jgi:hypothetical protein
MRFFDDGGVLISPLEGINICDVNKLQCKLRILLENVFRNRVISNRENLSKHKLTPTEKKDST